MKDSVCRDLDSVFAYLDDILITSQNAEIHNKHLVTLDRLEQDVFLVLQKSTSWYIKSQVLVVHNCHKK